MIFTIDIEACEHTKEDIKKEYFNLSRVMRSVSAQIASQIHLNAFEYKSVAAFNFDHGFELYDPKTRGLGNFWYRIHAGRSMKSNNYFEHFLTTVNWYTAETLRHCLWKLIDQKISPAHVIKFLPFYIKQKLLIKQAGSLKGSELSLASLKQSYKKQRLNFYYQQDFDALAALLIVSIVQIHQLKHTRPTSAEKFTYGLFLYLFGYKYRTLRKIEMGNKINALLLGSISNRENDELNQRLTLDFEKVETIKTIGIQNQVENLDQFVSDEILKNILSKPDHRYFYS